MNIKIRSIQPFGLLIEPKQAMFMLDDIDLSQLRTLIQNEQLLVLRGFNTFHNTEDFAAYCERWGEISIWPFGKVLELIEQDNPADHIFDNSYIPLHWDGMYRLQVPELQIFRCVQAPLKGQGGRTTFSNTLLALKHAPSSAKNLWSKVTGIYERKMEFYSSRTKAAIIDKHPFRDHAVIRYNEPPVETKGKFINPPKLSFTGIDTDQLETFHHSLRSALYAPSNYYAHEWQTGDIVIADNFSLLHGRESFTTKSPRHIQRVHVLSNPPLNNPGLESYK